MNQRTFTRGTFLCLLILLAFISSSFHSSALVAPTSSARPSEFDVRGPQGVPKGTDLRAPTAAQAKSLGSLQTLVNGSLVVRYNGRVAQRVQELEL